MYGRLARHLVCPLHERLVGRPTFRFLRELERSQWYAPNEVRALQAGKLGNLLAHARANTSFYRDRLSHWEKMSPDVDVPEALKGVPLLTKDDIRESGEDMLWRDAPGGVHPYTTGGSGGEPLAFYFDRRRQACDQAARIRTHRWFGVEVGDRELFLWGSPIELGRTNRLRRIRDRLFNHLLLDAFNMSPAHMDQYLEAWKRFRPTCLFGYPSSIALLADYARSCGHAPDLRSLRAVFVTGEVCHPPLRETIESFFEAPVADGYGSREAGFIAHQCLEGNLHITAEHVIVEIVNAKGEVLPEGEPGEMVVTHLDAYAMPFIRYRTGDCGRLKPGRCACGRGLPMLDVVEGRTTDFLYLPDGTIKHALSIIYPIRECAGVRQFRVTQQKDYSIVVDVVADDRRERISLESVRRRVRPVIGDTVDLRVEFVDRIPAADSGKYRHVISHVPSAVQNAKREEGADG